MFWLYLLGIVTFLIIALRRVLRRQKPLNDELYSTRVAIKHVHSGVAWVPQDGLIGSVNESLARLTASGTAALAGQDWYGLFPEAERARVREAYTQMLLGGIASLGTAITRAGSGQPHAVNLRLVPVHDHRARLVGHHVLIHDLSRERALEDQLHQLSNAIGRSEPAVAATAQITQGLGAGILQK